MRQNTEKGTLMMFLSLVSIWPWLPSEPMLIWRTVPTFGFSMRLDRPEGEVQARLGGAVVLAEAQHHAALVRLNLIDAVDANEAGENAESE